MKCFPKIESKRSRELQGVWGNYQQWASAILLILTAASTLSIFVSSRFKLHDKRREKGPSSACQGCDGVLHIAFADEVGAFGCDFFLNVLNQLIYADMHNLKPWVHLTGGVDLIYDDRVHGNSTSKSLSFVMKGGMAASLEAYMLKGKTYVYTGKPVVRKELKDAVFAVSGNGIWNTYFEPASNFIPGVDDPSCRDKPLLSLNPKQIASIVEKAPWSVVPYPAVMPSVGYQMNVVHYNLHDWYGNMRHRGQEIVKKYYRPKPKYLELAERVNPKAAADGSPPPCLAMHIRHSDKADGRQIIPTDKFLPYANIFLANGGQTIFLATDSTKVIDKVRRKWSLPAAANLRFQGNITRSSNKTAVFALGHSRHETNEEIFVDILAMRKCDFFVHGFSTVSEAVHYLNPKLHDQSVNLDESNHMSVEEFGVIVRNVIKNGTTP